MATPLRYSIERLEVFREELERLKSSTFPYKHSLDALEILEKDVAEHIKNLEALNNSSDSLVVQAACSASIALLYRYLPYAGFLLRSTNVRNAFEVYGPMLWISRQVLGKSTKLVLSSEWDFSPYTFVDNVSLPDFVLIGLPASESSNPLLLPVAGHELGHTIWTKLVDTVTYSSELTRAVIAHIRRYWDEYRESNEPNPDFKVEDLESDIFAQKAWAPALESAFRQAQESFCDFVGVRIFGESYLNAFAYLVAPGSGERSPDYPADRNRARNLLRAARKLGFSSPNDYEDLFVEPNTPLDFMQRTADTAVNSLIDDLVNDADKLVNNAKIPKPDPDKISEIYDIYKRWVVPERNPATLSNILNAAWKAYLDDTLWDDKPHIADKKFVLKELVLKNIEVLEIATRLEKKV